MILPALWLAAVALAEDLPTPEQVLELIDQNLTFESRTTKVAMTVESGKRVKTYEMMTFGRGQDQAAIEYLEPARDKGTRNHSQDVTAAL